MQAIDSSAVSIVTHDAAPVICDAQAQPKKMVDLMREACAVRHYSLRTFQAYWHWQTARLVAAVGKIGKKAA